MTTTKRILRFAKVTLMQGIHFTKSRATNLVVFYCDSDIAGDANNRRSVTGRKFDNVVI